MNYANYSSVPPDVWVTVCGKCGDWTTGIFHLGLDGTPYCFDCAAAMGIATGPPQKKYIPVGPPAPKGSMCRCGRAAVAQCLGCLRSFCRPCWYRHSHGGPIGTAAWKPEPIEDAA